MEQSIIDSVAAAGFDVWMRDPKDSWMLFTDGKNIGYLQADRLVGYCISTVHMPNTTTGTGFQIERHIADFSSDMLARAFGVAPTWAGGREHDSVHKYRDIEHYRNANNFNEAYRLVAPRATLEG